MATAGFKYFFGIHMGIGRAADELLEIRVGDKTAWRGTVTANSTIPIEAPELFGGVKAEGGVQGDLTCLFGGAAQVAPAAMVTAFGGPLPGFRRTFTLFFNGMIAAINPYPKPWAVRYRRVSSEWDGGEWYPAKSTVWIVRPVSQGEVAEGSTEAKTISVAVDGIPTVVTPSTTWQYTIDTVEPAVAVTEVYIETGYNSEGNHFERYVLTAGTDYTVAANVITFVVANAATYDDRKVFVTYTKSIQSLVPITGTLGTTLIKAMNGAHIVYECLTNREWGRGLPRTALDEDAFKIAADTLFSEGFGLCLRWRRRDEVQSFIQSVLDHVGGVLFTSRITGKLVLRLMRSDYDQGDLPLYDTENGLLEVTDAAVGSAGKMITELRVTYRDPVTNEDRVVRSSNLAARMASGGITNALSKEYPGLPTAELASRIAARDVRAASPRLRRFSVVLDRRANKLEPGGLVRIQDLSRNIIDMVLRIATIDFGSARDGRIKVQGVQDVFGTPKTGVSVIGPPEWTPPPQRACTGLARTFELPYRTVYKRLNTADFSFVDSGSAYVGLAQDKGNPINANGLVGMAVKYGKRLLTEYPATNTYFCGMPFAPPVPCDTFWPNVALLLHCDSIGVGAALVDSSGFASRATAVNGTLNTTDKMFGLGSLSLLAGRITLSPPVAWVGRPPYAPQTGDFCVEFWMKTPAIIDAFLPIVSFPYDAGTGKYAALMTNGGHTFYVTQLIAPGNQPTVANGSNLPRGAWFHFAWTRASGTSRIFFNGVQQASWADNYDYNTTALDIHSTDVQFGNTPTLVDEVRVTVGQARYTANFTPPTEVFPGVSC